MFKKDKQIGTYYGKLISLKELKKLNNNINITTHFGYCSYSDILDFIKQLKCYIIDIKFDLHEDHVDNMYLIFKEQLTTKQMTKMTSIIHNMFPDECNSPKNNNCLRLWWD